MQLLALVSLPECKGLHAFYGWITKGRGCMFCPVTHRFEIGLVAEPLTFDSCIMLKKAFLFVQSLLLAIGAIERIIVTEEFFRDWLGCLPGRIRQNRIKAVL